RLRSDELLRVLRHRGAVLRPLRAAARSTCARRLTCREEDRSVLGGHLPHRWAHIRGPPPRSGRAHGRAYDLPGADARTDRRGVDALMSGWMRNLVSSAIAIVVLTAVFGFAYPALMTAFGQVAFSHQADGSLIKVDGKVVGSKLAGQEFK